MQFHKVTYNQINNLITFSSFPKMYACKIDDENGIHILIMEDLRANKYGMWPREKVIPLEHQLFFIRELGKFVSR